MNIGKLGSALTLSALLLFTGCKSDQQIRDIVKEEVQKSLSENPDAVIAAIKSNPLKFMEALQVAARQAQVDAAKKREEEEKKKLEEAFEKPIMAEIRNDEFIRGKKEAPITLVEYSDFECPFCSKAFDIVQELREKYGDNIRFVYKHQPLSFHPNAMVASKYMEAIRLQSAEKGWKFHDEIFQNQRKLKNGESYLKSIAKKLGVDMSKLEKDVESEKVISRIKEDITEANKFGFEGTPGFLINGVPVRGAFPSSHFVEIVEELKKRGKINL